MTTKDIKETKEFYSTEGIPEHLKQPLSFMRQWLNEDRKATPMVTARDLWHWLEKAYTHHYQAEVQRALETEKKRCDIRVKKEAEELTKRKIAHGQAMYEKGKRESN